MGETKGKSKPFNLRRFSITARLQIVFAAIIALVLFGSTVGFLHFRNVATRAALVSESERRLSSVLRLNNSLLAFTSALHRTADRESAPEFTAEVAEQMRKFTAESPGYLRTLDEIAKDNSQYSIPVGSIQGLIESMPRRMASLSDLATRGDWVVLHARLMNQTDQTDDIIAALMSRLETDLADARERLSSDLALAQDRAIQTLTITAALSIVIAMLLRTAVTASVRLPLLQLDKGSRALAAGDFSHRIRIDGEDELTDVAHAFNRMAGELERLFADVRHQHAIADAAKTELQEQARELARANADLQQFAYSASHDLQEPLRTISLYSQLLQRRRNAPNHDRGVDECIDFMYSASNHMQQLIADLLAYTRAGNVERKVETPADMNVVLHRVLASLQAQIEDEHCTITGAPLPLVCAHESHVVQLLQNLISNAIKYRMEDRDPAIEIGAERRGAFWEIHVKDNGIGIEPQYTRQIFGMFKRLHGKNYSGTGIGLAICQKIVEGYGGEIWVESEPGRSSTFRFTLPAA